MPDPDKRNVLRVGPPEHPGGTEITPAMVENVRQRIKDAGGIHRLGGAAWPKSIRLSWPWWRNNSASTPDR